MNNTLIGVSGDIGSFSEQAARHYADAMGLHYSLQYDITMEGVLAALAAKQIELGIFPVHNTLGGVVTQAMEAMGKYRFTFITAFPMKIEQCLMAKSNLSLENITQIISHPQGLAQCHQFISTQLKHADITNADDTALAARWLSKGQYPDTAAVIAPESCAITYGLTLLQKGVQDTHDNTTTFIVVSTGES